MSCLANYILHFTRGSYFGYPYFCVAILSIQAYVGETMTPKVRVLVKPRFRFWVPWKYVTGNVNVLSENREDAGIYQDNALYKVQDFYLFSRLDYEVVPSRRDYK